MIDTVCYSMVHLLVVLGFLKTCFQYLGVLYDRCFV